jgi:hypothetical protein
MFDIHTVVTDFTMEFPREGDQFIMQVLERAGYTDKALSHLNRVRVSLQLLLMSDILTASGNKVNADILLRRPHGEAWSTMRWPNKYPTDSDMRQWRDTMISIFPSRCSTSGVGHFTSHLHKIWLWFWSKANSTLHHTNLNGRTEDVFVLGRKPNQFTYSHSQPSRAHKIICSV